MKSANFAVVDIDGELAAVLRVIPGCAPVAVPRDKAVTYAPRRSAAAEIMPSLAVAIRRAGHHPWRFLSSWFL